MFDVLDMDMKWILSNPYHKFSLHLLAKAKKETFSHQLLVIIMPKNSLTKWEIAKAIAPSVVTMVFLPIIDVASDITLVCNLYMHAHWHFATILLGQYKILNKNYLNTDFFSVPVLANYIISFYTWFRLEKSKRMDTFLYPLLNLYNVYGK